MDFILNKGAELFQHNRNLEPSTNSLKRKLGELNCVKEDVESKMKNELHPGKKLKKQVENWFENVGLINREVGNLEQEVRASNFLSSGSLAEKISRAEAEVEYIIQKGSFSDGLVIDDPSQTGIQWDTTGFMGEGLEKTLNDVWELLMDDHVETIGVHGMGGVGKTTIVKQLNNRLQKEVRRRVIWATASKDQFNIVRLQARIADGFKVDLSEGEGKAIRAGELFSVLSKQKEYVLILDDLWDKISLNDVGIPRPSSNKSKIIVTSRSRDVLQYLDCDIVKVELLKEEMSWKLFVEKVGKSILEHRDLIPVAESVAKECGGLPLAIVTVASSMKGVYEVGEWRNALNELRKHLNSIKGIDGDIIKMLQFSYDHLKDMDIQQCFLSCAFYPEDEEINKEELINYWIGEEMIQEMERRSDQIDRCSSIINKLKSNCLLECGFDFQKSVKMHDLVRDMALHIIRTGPRRFFIQAGMHKNKMPTKEEFGENVEKVSLMCNRIEFGGDYWTPSSPGCLMLTTLLLQRNNIDWIPECFFEGMPNLMFLNLSHNPFRNLPKSLSDLKNLTSLTLQHCKNLKDVPCLSRLQRLKQLDLRGTTITSLPIGMEELVNLKYLDLSPGQGELLGHYMGDNFILKGISGAMSENYWSLKHLAPYVKITAGKVGNLKRLEYIYSWFGDVSDLKEFVASRGREFLPYYCITVGAFVDHSIASGYGLSRDTRTILLADVDTGGKLIQLPSNVVRLEIISVKGGTRCLNDFISITSQGEATDLRYLGISYCGDMERVFSAGYPQINNLSTLRLEGLCKLTAVCSPCPSTCMLSSLARIHIFKCNKLKEVFSYDCLPHNLEVIEVTGCDQMEKIVTWEEGSRIASGGSSDTTQTQLLCLPKLKILMLFNLPQLKSIFSESRITIASDALKKIRVDNCRLLRKVPLHLTPDSHLEVIDVSNCDKMEEIVTSMEGSRTASGLINNSNSTQTQLLRLPKLRGLELRNLPQLRSIFPESRIIMACDALIKIEVNNCPLLRRVPLHLPLLPDNQPFPPPCLRIVVIHPLKRWHSFDWGHPDAKAVLLPFLWCVSSEERGAIKRVEQDVLDALAATSSSGQM